MGAQTDLREPSVLFRDIREDSSEPIISLQLNDAGYTSLVGLSRECFLRPSISAAFASSLLPDWQ